VLVCFFAQRLIFDWVTPSDWCFPDTDTQQHNMLHYVFKLRIWPIIQTTESKHCSQCGTHSVVYGLVRMEFDLHRAVKANPLLTVC